jgi:hypothetical protein
LIVVVLDAEGAKYQVVPTIEEAVNSRQSCAGDLNESILEADGINVVAMAGSTSSSDHVHPMVWNNSGVC